MPAVSPACSLPGPWQLSHWTFALAAVLGCLRTKSAHVAPLNTKPSAAAIWANPSFGAVPDVIRLNPMVRESIENSEPKSNASCHVSLAWLAAWCGSAGSSKLSKTFACRVSFHVVAKLASQGNWPAWQEAHSPLKGSGGVPVRFPTPTYLPLVMSMTLTTLPGFCVRITWYGPGRSGTKYTNRWSVAAPRAVLSGLKKLMAAPVGLKPVQVQDVMGFTPAVAAPFMNAGSPKATFSFAIVSANGPTLK